MKLKTREGLDASSSAFKTKQNQVADLLRENIFAGVYPRGQRLKQIDIAHQIGVSPTPVREALRILEAEGYVTAISHRGVMIPLLNYHEAKEIFELRLLLERELTAIAVSRMTRAKLEQLQSLNRDLLAAGLASDWSGFRTTNYRLHFALYETANRPQTLQFVRVLWAKYPFLRGIERSQVQSMVAEHDEFLKKISIGDEAGAVGALVKHLHAGWDGIDWSTAPTAQGDAPDD